MMKKTGDSSGNIPKSILRRLTFEDAVLAACCVLTLEY